MGLSIVTKSHLSTDRRDQARVGHEDGKVGGISRGDASAAPSKPKTTLDKLQDAFEDAAKPARVEDRR